MESLQQRCESEHSYFECVVMRKTRKQGRCLYSQVGTRTESPMRNCWTYDLNVRLQIFYTSFSDSKAYKTDTAPDFCAYWSAPVSTFPVKYQHSLPPASKYVIRFFYRAILHRARWCHNMPSVCLSVYLSVCLFVTFRYRDHTGWNTSKIISRLNSLRYVPRFTPTSAIWSNGNTPKLGWNRDGARNT